MKENKGGSGSKQLPRIGLRLQKYIQPLIVYCMLYPLERIQSVRQIQSTYNKKLLSQSADTFTRCTHYGFRSWYRGFTPFLLRTTGLYFFVQGGNSFCDQRNLKKSDPLQDSSRNSNAFNFYVSAIKSGIASIGYAIFYPFQVLQLRLGSQIESERIYKNMAQCIQKVKKIEGKLINTLYRGFSLSLMHLLLRLNTMSYFFSQLKSQDLKTFSNPLPDFLHSDSGISQFLIAYTLSEFMLYPLDSIRKIIQINGAIGHDNKFIRYQDVNKLYNKSFIYRGFGVRFTNSLIYFSGIWALQNNVFK